MVGHWHHHGPHGIEVTPPRGHLCAARWCHQPEVSAPDHLTSVFFGVQIEWFEVLKFQWSKAKKSFSTKIATMLQCWMDWNQTRGISTWFQFSVLFRIQCLPVQNFPPDRPTTVGFGTRWRSSPVGWQSDWAPTWDFPSANCSRIRPVDTGPEKWCLISH